jgi:drug/metabolite transporter (DMT)-like permease
LWYNRAVLPIVLAAASALIWGTADFSGGKASQRGNPLAVTVVSQILSVPILAVCLLLVPGEPRVADLVWGATSGAAGVAGIVLLYRALAGGAMAVVAPVTAVTAAVVPMAVGLLVSRTPGTAALAGAGCAIVAIALVSLGPGGGRGSVTGGLVGLALLAGVLFGLFFALLGQASEQSGMWSLVGVRFASIGVGLAWAAVTRTPLRLSSRVMRWAALAGPLDTTANAFYIAAAARGHLTIVAAVASLYPATTVLLAFLVDREKMRLAQVAGLGLAAAALVLTAS